MMVAESRYDVRLGSPRPLAISLTYSSIPDSQDLYRAYDCLAHCYERTARVCSEMTCIF